MEVPVLICLPARFPKEVPSALTATCSDCGQAVWVSSRAPKLRVILCLECLARMGLPDEAEVMPTPGLAEDLAESGVDANVNDLQRITEVLRDALSR